MEKGEMTIDKVKALHRSINTLCEQYVEANRADLIADVKDMIPRVQEFALWFIGEPDIGMNPEEKDSMNKNMLGLLNDLTDALKYKDSVLMYDVLECGIDEYLKLFIPGEETGNE